MVVLALETVTPQGSGAVWHDGSCLARTGDSAVPHATRLPGALTSALEAAGQQLDAVDRLAVVSGPGSFTGVRIGMASMQGLALTRGWPVTPIPTLDAIAECWRNANRDSSARTVIACLDGLRGEVFAREFRFEHAAMSPVGDPVVVTPEELTWDGFGSGVSIVGSGAVRYADVFRSRANEAIDTPEPIAAGAARLVARDAARPVAPHALSPLYVRRPDVELARERARANVR